MRAKQILEDDRILFKVAKLYYEERKTQEGIAWDFLTSKATVNRALEKAREKGIVRVQVINPKLPQGFRDIEEKLKITFDLKDAWLVPGRSEILDNSISDNAREALLGSIARAAATYLDMHLSNEDILCITRGRVMSYVIEHLRPSVLLKNLKIVPMLGVLSLQKDDFDAAFLVSEIALIYGSEYFSLPVPAIARDVSQMNAVSNLPLVSQSLNLIKKSTIAFTTISPADPENATIGKTGVIKKEEVEELIKNGAVGEIGFWFFDSKGDEIKIPNYHSIGLGLKGLKSMVKQKKNVIAVVGAHQNRFKPILAAIKGKIFNVLITDHITADKLLKITDK